MRKLVLLLVALLALLLVPVGPATAADTTPRLQRQGRFLVDQYGRVVIVHGLNLVWKRAPYAPPDTPGGFTAKDAASWRSTASTAPASACSGPVSPPTAPAWRTRRTSAAWTG